MNILQNIYRHKAEWVIEATEQAEESVLIPVHEDIADLSLVNILNQPAVDLLESLDGNCSLFELVIELAEKVNIDFDTLVNHIQEFIFHLENEGLIEVAGTIVDQIVTRPQVVGAETYTKPTITSVKVLESGRAFYEALCPGCCSGAQRCPNNLTP